MFKKLFKILFSAIFILGFSVLSYAQIYALELPLISYLFEENQVYDRASGKYIIDALYPDYTEIGAKIYFEKGFDTTDLEVHIIDEDGEIGVRNYDYSKDYTSAIGVSEDGEQTNDDFLTVTIPKSVIEKNKGKVDFVIVAEAGGTKETFGYTVNLKSRSLEETIKPFYYETPEYRTEDKIEEFKLVMGTDKFVYFLDLFNTANGIKLTDIKSSDEKIIKPLTSKTKYNTEQMMNRNTFARAELQPVGTGKCRITYYLTAGGKNAELSYEYEVFKFLEPEYYSTYLNFADSSDESLSHFYIQEQDISYSINSRRQTSAFISYYAPWENIWFGQSDDIVSSNPEVLEILKYPDRNKKYIVTRGNGETIITGKFLDTEVKTKITVKNYKSGIPVMGSRAYIQYFSETPVIIKNNRTLVPVRFAEMLDETVSWNPETREIIITQESYDLKTDKYNITRTVKMTAGSNIMEVNGEIIKMDVAAEIIDNRTMIPLRYAAEAFGIEVSWDGEKRIVYLDQ